ncbi:MAG TPA: hypothetical protein VJV78_17820 [Polyangiales bacterium]|nr:hypothetical protein [Polyangiales bacterium]
MMSVGVVEIWALLATATAVATVGFVYLVLLAKRFVRLHGRAQEERLHGPGAG